MNYSKPFFYSSLSVNFRYSGIVSEPTKTSNKNHSFYNTVSLKKLHYTNLTSLNIVKNILLQSSEIPYHFTNFPANLPLVGVG